MIDRSTWFWTIAAIVIWSVIVAEDAYPAELRVQHTSRITGKVIERTITVSDCLWSVKVLRAQVIGRIRTWCDGRRV